VPQQIHCFVQSMAGRLGPVVAHDDDQALGWRTLTGPRRR
jgi:hypothetical protein